MAAEPRTLGQLIREKRLAKGFSLRKFAEMVDVSPTYLSQVEQGKVDRPPTAERVRRMAALLGETAAECVALAGRLPPDISDLIKQKPTQLPELLREASGLTLDELRRVTERIRRMKQKRKEES